MLDYGLESNEVVLVECEKAVPRENNFFNTEGVLVLTNKNILWVTTNFFGKVKDIIKHPLSDIKIYDGKAQVKLEEKFGEEPVLSLYYKNGQISYRMYEKANVKDFVNQLNKTVTGSDEDIVVKGAIPGVAFVGETIKGTADAFKSAFGIKPKKAEQAAIQCTYCGAKISGIKGTVVKCEYCGSSIRIE